MKKAMKNVVLYLGVILLPLGILIWAKATGQMAYSEYVFPASTLPLNEKVRVATQRFRAINVALAEGYKQSGPCVDGRGAGARGVYFLRTDRVADGVLRADAPEALIYQAMPSGTWRLVGAEYIKTAREWESRAPDGEQPSLDGSRLRLIGAPNRFGLPAFYELHVWVSAGEPPASFADPNMHETCDLIINDD